MSTPNAKDHMNVLHFLLDALPHITGSVAGSESVVSSPMRY